MAKFYVEVWQRTGQSAEQHATLDTFKEAVAWLDERLAEQPSRLPRLRGYMSDEQIAQLTDRGMGPG